MAFDALQNIVYVTNRLGVIKDSSQTLGRNPDNENRIKTGDTITITTTDIGTGTRGGLSGLASELWKYRTNPSGPGNQMTVGDAWTTWTIPETIRYPYGFRPYSSPPIPSPNPPHSHITVEALKLELELEKQKRIALEEELAKLKQQPKSAETESLTERINNLKKKG